MVPMRDMSVLKMIETPPIFEWDCVVEEVLLEEAFALPEVVDLVHQAGEGCRVVVVLDVLTIGSDRDEVLVAVRNEGVVVRHDDAVDSVNEWKESDLRLPR